ncbi:MAG: hypothetical protein BGN94_08365 [Rhizobiales bacterium 68-8]|nr:MAG: hypothetical protein BGN94_08365 [Rhizobiales bacterium 68-8]
MTREQVGPCLGAGAGEITVDAAHADLADLGNLFEQTVGDLAEALSASISTARRGERASEGMGSDPRIAISLETSQETILRELQAGNTPQVRYIVPEQGQNWQF